MISKIKIWFPSDIFGENITSLKEILSSLQEGNHSYLIKRAIYSNYEILNQVFMGKTIDLNQVNKINFEFATSNKQQLHKFLRKSNPFDVNELRKKIYEKLV